MTWTNFSDRAKKLFSAHWLIIAITLLALVIRFYHLSDIPGALYNDEVANTYIGRYILENGHDLFGQKWPVFYSNKFKDYPPVVPMYLSGFSTYIFGINSFSSRFPAALFGTLTIPLVYLLGKRLLFSPKQAALSALFLAIALGHISLSRSSVEVVIALFVFCLGCLSFFSVEKDFKHWSITLGLFLLTYILYPTFRVFIPLFLVTYLVVEILTNRNIVTGLVQHRWQFLILIVALLASLISTQTVWGRSRFSTISIFSDPLTLAHIQQTNKSFQNEDPGPLKNVSKIFHNQPLSIVQEFTDNYFSYLSPQYLFETGGQPYRFAVPNVGVANLTISLLGLTAIALSFFKNPKRILFLGSWIAVSVIPAALTVDEIPSLQRSVVMLLPMCLLAGAGAGDLFGVLATRPLIKMVTIGLMVILFFWEIFYGLHQYFVHASQFESFYRQDGTKEMALTLIDLNRKTEGKNILVPNASNWEGVYYLFYSQKFPSALPQPGELMMFPKLDNLEFTRNSCPSRDIIDTNIYHYAYIAEMGICPLWERFNISLEKTIMRQDNSVAYRIYQVH